MQTMEQIILANVITALQPRAKAVLISHRFVRFVGSRGQYCYNRAKKSSTQA